MEREPWATPVTEGERRVLELLASGRPAVEIAAELGVSRDEVAERIMSVLTKLRREFTPPDPTPPPPAAAAALAVPYRRAEDVPRHVGRYLPRRRSPAP